MTPIEYAKRFAAVHIALGDVDPILSTPAEYAAAGELDRIASVSVLGDVVATVLDHLRSVAAMSEWTAELQRRTVIEVEMVLTGRTLAEVHAQVLLNHATMAPVLP